MGAWQIPLEGQRAPQINPFQAYQQGQQGELTAQAMQQQQQLRQQQTQAEELLNQKDQMDIAATQALNRAWQEGWAPSQQPGSQSPPPNQSPAPAQPANPPPLATDASGRPTLMTPDGQAPHGGNPWASTPPPTDSATPAPVAPAPPLSGQQAATSQPASPTAPALPSFDFNRVVDSLVKSGQGSVVPGVMKNYLDRMTSQATLYKDQTALHRDTATEATQLLQGIPQISGATPEETQQLRDQAFQHVLPQFSQLERQLDPNSQVMSHWDDNMGAQYIANGTGVADFSNRLHQAADLALRIHQDLPKSVGEAQSQVDHDLGNVNSPQQFQDLVGKYTALAQHEKQIDPQGVSVYAQALSTLPKTWTPDVSLQAQVEGLKPEDRTKFFQNRLEYTAQQLSAAARQGQSPYAAQLAKVTASDPDEASLFPPATGTFDADSVGRQAAEVGMTGVQKITAQNTMEFREDLLGIRQQLLDLAKAKGGGGQGNGATPGDGTAPTPSQRNQARNQFYSFQKQEQQGGKGGQSLWLELHNLQNPPTSGAPAPDAGNLAAQIEAKQTQLRNVVTGKYQAAQRAGIPMDVSLNDVLGKIGGTAGTTQANAPAPSGARPGSPPPPDIAARIPEGRRVRVPDGTIWTKQNGQMVQAQ